MSSVKFLSFDDAHRPSSLAVNFHLLGQLDFDHLLGLQRRIAYELGGEPQRRAVVLLCEHPPLISIGRRGSRGHIRLTNQQLRARQLDVRWVGRGGGCILHGPGQLSIYVLVSLDALGWSVPQYARQLQSAVQQALQTVGIRTELGQQDSGLWAGSGQVAAMGLAVRNQVAQHGMFLNVNPDMTNYHYIQTPAPHTSRGQMRQTMGCLAAERNQSIKISEIRAALIERLSQTLAHGRYHVLAGHPWIPAAYSTRDAHARAS